MKRVTVKYGIPLDDFPAFCLDAVDAAERSRARTLIVRGGAPVAAIVSMPDFEKIEPADPGASGADPLLALCGACRHDDFVNTFIVEPTSSGLWRRGV
ncbi:MAG TPA: hypothetical protein VE093_22865 [Polyangiaceae bacterium]|jgi:hypothetical protein|nr:hypothetical protein [Polyangiaceae bacterium]